MSAIYFADGLLLTCSQSAFFLFLSYVMFQKDELHSVICVQELNVITSSVNTEQKSQKGSRGTDQRPLGAK